MSILSVAVDGIRQACADMAWGTERTISRSPTDVSEYFTKMTCRCPKCRLFIFPGQWLQ